MSENQDTGLYAGLMLAAPKNKTPDKRRGSKREKEQLGRILSRIASKMPTLKPKERMCGECGKWVNADDGQFVMDGDPFVCISCRDDNFFKCRGCGEYFPNDEGKEGIVTADLWCDRCWDDTFFECYKCGDVTKKDSALEGGGEYYCETCFNDRFTTCNRCGKVMDKEDDDVVQYGDEEWCRRCADRCLSYCEHCENYTHNDDFRNHRDGYAGCSSCYDEYCNDNPDEEEGSSATIHEHNYKPAPIYFKTEKDEGLRPDQRAYIGFELEVEAMGGDRTEGAEKATEMSTINGNQLFYCKEDGSINHGFEVVSHPMTRNFMFCEKKGAKRVITDTITMLRRSGFRSYNTDTCGLHFHLSRKHFDGTFHLFKFLRFWYAMDKAFVVLVSGRRDERAMQQYCSLTDENYSNDPQKTVIFKAKEKFGRNRYQAVNLCNRHTVEVRIFKGTLNVDSFFRKAEMMFAAIEFTRKAPHSFTVEDFFRWVNEHYKEYPYSFGWLTSKRLITQVKMEEEIACA